MSSSDHIEPPRTPSGSQVHITHHARQRYLERVDAEETYPAEAIREVWRAVQDDEGSRGEYDHAAIVLVYTVDHDGPAVLTVYPNDERDVPEVLRA